MITDFHAKYLAHELTKRCAPDSSERLAGAVAGAQVDLNPHQVDAALFAFASPLSKGALLADEVGLGKTIEAGLVISQRWAERKRRILVITPSNLRKQWHQELSEKFLLPGVILESKSYNQSIRDGSIEPFEVKKSIVICSYQFARSKASDVRRVPWDLVVIDEAHRLRNVYKPSNIIANTLKNALAQKNKILLTATPLQNSLLELYGLVSFIDEHAFGDVKSFREQFANPGDKRNFEALKERLKPICHRTLRRQVTAYIPYTRRLPLVEEFTPADGEDRLYQLVSDYLVIARDTTHSAELMALVKSAAFFEGRYADKVIQVDSSVKEEETIERLLKVESPEEPTEIVIHVNMLKEGWDVTNLYTIVPLRAANARTLIEQSIGRGLRLPYGRRTGVTAVDRLNIVAHDRFQEIVDEARKPDSAIRLQQVILTEGQLQQKTVTVESRPQLAAKLGLRSDAPANGASGFEEAPAEFTHEEQQVVRIAYDVIRKMETEPSRLPSVAHLQKPEVQAAVLREVQSQYRPAQLELDGIAKQPDLTAIVAKTVELVVQQTIDIPRILVTPKGEVKSGFHHFTLDLSRMRYEVPNETLWAAHLRTGQVDRIGLGAGNIDEQRLEDYVVSGLIDFDDVAYDEHADLLYDLVAQVANHLLATHPEDGVRKILRLHRQEIARFVHAQMQSHFWQDTEVEYEIVVTRGFTELRKSAYTAAAGEAPLDFRQSPADKANMARYLFGGFQKCLYPTQKFQSDAERKLSVILDREAQKWFKPARGQFQLFYRSGTDLQEYQPDFVAETDDCILMLEPKASNQMTDPDVLAKRDSALEWCRHASRHAASYGGKPWRYALIPHDAIAENMTLVGLLQQFGVTR